MTLPPRAILVHRRTELDDAVARHGTHGQAAFFLSSRGRSIKELEARHARTQQALAAVAAAIPTDWRRGRVEREDLSRFLFERRDVVIVVGQDGLVANVAKYLDGQQVIGVDPEPERNAGVLVKHAPCNVAELIRVVAQQNSNVETRTMVAAVTDDGQQLLALNEVFVGHASHQTARYTLTDDGRTERQASSGVIVSTGTGATGWCRSVWQERSSTLELPTPTEPRLAWFVREAWPSPTTGTSLVEGIVKAKATLTVDVESDRLVVFGDGIESDALTLAWGQRLKLQLAEQQLRLVR